MTPEEQRIAIAEACGWSGFQKGPYDGAPFGQQHTRFEMRPVPDYLSDLNAMHEAEITLTLDQQPTYMSALCKVLARSHKIDYHWFSFTGITATAAQRAEAFCRTLFPDRFDCTIFKNQDGH